MALRLLLVGLVVGLGFELPGGEEIAALARSGSAWIQARIDGLTGPEVVEEPGPTDDEAFSAIVDGMATSFAADLARAEAPAPRAAEPPAPRRAVAFEPLDIPDDLEPGVAFALNHDAQGASLMPVADAGRHDGESAVEGRLERMASAIRLTRQAASAWMSVLRGAEAAALVR